MSGAVGGSHPLEGRVQTADTFPDLKVQYVDVFHGVP